MSSISIISSLLLKKNPPISSLCFSVFYFSQKCLFIVCLNQVPHKVNILHLFNNFLSFILRVFLHLPFCHLFKKLHHLSFRSSYNLTLAVCSLVMQFIKFLCFASLILISYKLIMRYRVLINFYLFVFVVVILARPLHITSYCIVFKRHIISGCPTITYVKIDQLIEVYQREPSIVKFPFNFLFKLIALAPIDGKLHCFTRASTIAILLLFHSFHVQ